MTKNSIFITLIIACLSISFLLTGCSAYEQVKEFIHPDYIKCYVAKVIDVDTFDCQLSDVNIERVRLIGIGISESITDNATDFSKSYLRRGTPVKLELDEQIRDRDGRILAYVYLPGGKMLNTLLIQEGFGQVIINPPNIKYKDLFLRVETEAREQRKGIWKGK
ncbi:MAG TPA: thermonuclease family protein [Thermodesulfobacteriota bacterium]|nr:thermonuclease family protein [Thermodesulfobacteriota bacterium]